MAARLWSMPPPIPPFARQVGGSAGYWAQSAAPHSDHRAFAIGSCEAQKTLLKKTARPAESPFARWLPPAPPIPGIVDDLVAMADICHRHKLWLHVDGAYGAAVVFF